MAAATSAQVIGGRPAEAASAVRKVSSVRPRSTARAMAAGSVGSKRASGPTISGSDDVAAASTGVPQASASATGSP